MKLIFRLVLLLLYFKSIKLEVTPLWELQEEVGRDLPESHELDLRVPEPDPTFHKHKHKVHTHIHSHTSSHQHGSFHGTPVVTPVLFPGSSSGIQQVNHQSQTFHHGSNFGNNQGFGTSNSASHGYNPQFISNQHIHQNNHMFANQNQEITNYNNNFNTQGHTGFQNGVNNGQIAQINGQNNAGTSAFQDSYNNRQIAQINGQNNAGAGAFQNGFDNRQIAQINEQNNAGTSSFQNSFNNRQIAQISGQNNAGTSTFQNSFNNRQIAQINGQNTAGTSTFQNNFNNMQIAQVNGQNNAVSQTVHGLSSSGAPIFSGRETNPMLNEEDIRRMRNEELQNEENPLNYEGQELWQNYPIDNKNFNAPQYDTEMNKILDVLDERSYFHIRPEVTTFAHFEKGGLMDVNQQPIWDHMYERSSEGKKFEKDDSDILESPYLIQIPNNSKYDRWEFSNDRNKRSEESDIAPHNSSNFLLPNVNDTLQSYRGMIDSYRHKIKLKDEVIFTDFLGSIVDDFEKKELLKSNNIKKIVKRTAPIERLFQSPTVKLDVPKTLENIGTIAKNTFENERSPMYHVRSLMGSTKNAVLSAMRIPPQNFMIPSNYEIKNINPEEITDDSDKYVGDINQKILSRSSFSNDDSLQNSNEINGITNDPYGIVETFTRVGSAIRDSVRSGQNTLSHIGDIAHNAKKILQSTKNSIPRVIIPSANPPVRLRSRFKDIKKPSIRKAIIISPRVLDIKNPLLSSTNLESNYITMGDMLDAVGISKPNRNHLDLDKFTLKTPGNHGIKAIYFPPVGEVKSVNGQNLPNSRKAQEVVSSSNGEVWKTKFEGLNNNNKNTNEEIDNPDSKVNHKNIQIKNRLNTKLMKKKHFTDKEEDEIIDKFLKNILKNDKQNRNKIPAIFSENDLKDTNPRKLNKKKLNSYFENMDDPNINKLLQEITKDVLKNEAKLSKTRIPNVPKFNKSNKITKINMRNRNKLNDIVKGDVIVESRFGDQDDIRVTTTIPVQTEKALTSEEETAKKIDEYVLNDITPSKSMSNDEKAKGWKIGNVIQLVNENPSEKSSIDNEIKENSHHFSSRSLLSLPDNEVNEEEIVGLDLPVELMRPFMARVSDSEAQRIFNSDVDQHFNDHNNESSPEPILGMSNPQMNTNSQYNYPNWYSYSPSENFRRIISKTGRNLEFKNEEIERSNFDSQMNNEVYEPLERESSSDEQQAQPRTSMILNDSLKKPFMGMGNDDNIKQFYTEYNGDEGDFSEKEEILFSDSE